MTGKLDLRTGKAMDFKLPIGELTANLKCKMPYSDVQVGTPAANIITTNVRHKTTIVNTPALAANATINVTSTDGDAEAGDEIIFNILCGGAARTITFGTLLATDGAAFVATANKTSSIRFVHDGTAFREVSRNIAA